MTRGPSYIMLGRRVIHHSPARLGGRITPEESAVEMYRTITPRGEPMEMRPRRDEPPMRTQPPHRPMTPREMDDLDEAWNNREAT